MLSKLNFMLLAPTASFLLNHLVQVRGEKEWPLDLSRLKRIFFVFMHNSIDSFSNYFVLGSNLCPPPLGLFRSFKLSLLIPQFDGVYCSFWIHFSPELETFKTIFILGTW